MKNYKKILCGALAAAMVLTTAAVPVSAAAKPALNKTKLSLTVGQTATLKVKNTAKKETVKWSSNKKTVAAVTSKGKVTAKKAGSAVVKATLKKAGKTLKCNVTVKKAASNPTPAAPTTQDVTANLAGKYYKGTAEVMGTSMEVLSLVFTNVSGSDVYTVTGSVFETASMSMKEISGTYKATLTYTTAPATDGTVTVNITTDAGTELPQTLLKVVKDDFSEFSSTQSTSYGDINVTVTEVPAGSN